MDDDDVDESRREICINSIVNNCSGKVHLYQPKNKKQIPEYHLHICLLDPFLCVCVGGGGLVLWTKEWNEWSKMVSRARRNISTHIPVIVVCCIIGKQKKKKLQIQIFYSGTG